MEKTVGTLAELEAEAARFVAGLAPSPRGATLVTLAGELGAGKTAFTKAVAKALGVDETVTSPTFVLEKIYVLPEGRGFKWLVHIDAYRLTNAAELAPLNVDELLHDPRNLILLEWPENVADASLSPAVKIFLTVLSDGSRRILYG